MDATYADLRPFATALTLTQPRLLALFIAVPLFARQMLPGMLRLGIAAGIGALAAPPLMAQLPALPPGPELVALAVKESLLGFALGYLLALPFWAFEAVGFLIDNQRGASVGSTLNPLTGNDSSDLGLLFSQGFMAFVFTSGAFTLMLGIVYQSFVLWPVLQWQPGLSAAGPVEWLGRLDGLERAALLMAAPVVIAMFLSELGLALVSRFAPQLQVFFLAMPIKSGLALLVLVMYMGTLFSDAGDALRQQWQDVLPFLSRAVAGHR